MNPFASSAKSSHRNLNLPPMGNSRRFRPSQRPRGRGRKRYKEEEEDDYDPEEEEDQFQNLRDSFGEQNN